MKEELLPFYLQGRAIKSLGILRKHVDSPEEIATTIGKGADVRQAIATACAAAASQLRGDRRRREKWLAENKEDLVGAPSSDEAWKAFCDGAADELAYAMEPDVLDVLEAEHAEEGGDDEEDDSDDENDDDEDDSGRSRR